MNEYSQQHLALPRALTASAECRAQDALVLGKGAFHMAPLAIQLTGEATFHLQPVTPLGPLPMVPSGVQGDDRGANPQLFPTETMKGFTVIGGIGEEAIPLQKRGGLPYRRLKVGGIVAGTSPHHRTNPQVGFAVTDNGQFDPKSLGKPPGIGSMVQVVKAGVSRFEARGIYDALQVGGDQAALLGEGNNASQDVFKSPFFTRRASAFCMAVQ